MKNTCIFIFALILISCETKEEVQSAVSRLKIERTVLQVELSKLNLEVLSKQNDINLLEEKLKELHFLSEGNDPKYILKIHLQQSHMSLSISDHIKDSMNAIDFEMPVDKDFYHQVKAGDKIVDKFRSGSFVLYGKLGSWDMSIKSKEIR